MQSRTVAPPTAPALRSSSMSPARKKRPSLVARLLMTPALWLAGLAGIGAAYGLWRAFGPPVPIHLTFRQMQVLAQPMQPVLDLLGSVEGAYHSVNRGRAGDSPGDWASENLGQSITDMTLDELRGHQGGQNPRCWHQGRRGEANLFAVGRYQLVPCTLAGAMRRVDGLSLQMRYDPATQDGLAVYLLLVKRPRLGAWLLGQSDDYPRAAQELAKEFASVPIIEARGRCVPGQSYYCGDAAGNAALLTLSEVETALRATRQGLVTDPEAQTLIVTAEGAHGHYRRQVRRVWRTVTARWGL